MGSFISSSCYNNDLYTNIKRSIKCGLNMAEIDLMNEMYIATLNLNSHLKT